MSDPIVDPPAADPPKADPPKADPPKADPKADPPKADPSAGDPPKGFTQADVDRAVEKAKKDAKKETDAAAVIAKLSEDERKDAEIKGLKQSIQLRDAKEEVIAALTKDGAKGTELMWAAIKGELEFDEKTGKATNLKDLIKDLKADYPDSFGEPKPTESIDGGKGQDQNTGTLTKEKLAAMSPKEIQALDWEEVKKVMAAK